MPLKCTQQLLIQYCHKHARSILAAGSPLDPLLPSTMACMQDLLQLNVTIQAEVRETFGEFESSIVSDALKHTGELCAAKLPIPSASASIDRLQQWMGTARYTEVYLHILATGCLVHQACFQAFAPRALSPA